MSVFWLISAPAENGSKQETFRRLQTITNELSTNSKLEVPDLRVGTLDSLMTLSDELDRTDRYVEAVVHRLEKEAREQEKLKAAKSGRNAEDVQIGNKSAERFATTFEWDQARYPVKSPLVELVSMINGFVVQADEGLKTKVGEYNVVKGNKQQLERKKEGGLNARSLVGVVDKRHVVNTEKLTTLFCAVPKHNTKEFLSKYESYVTFETRGYELTAVVPQSASLVSSDNEYDLYRVVVFRTAEEKWKQKAREGKVTIRDFTFSEGQATIDTKELSDLKAEEEKLEGQLLRFAKTSYDEAFRAWMHLKSIRVFVESVLRYGLPANFQAMLVRPGKNADRLRKVLASTYAHLSAGYDKSDAEEGPNQPKFYPYVDIEMKLTAETE